ncbi:MAG: TRAP transporter large permease [Rhodospirillaceae bacterium]|jgi:tripartite ATP-independent transporter DctM subunit|nr:TRAP transporter large permease [Rhodospirillaceae bacterium]MBT4117467.1 TRAP transporter large permease [Rhodospirillaceae bacterium]MBT4670962.1 TRAP transporter large permease [Rhodospirillaceae bacterium]MBT4747752.1 TRAP transporter large permease [Rhodospirillaceae bacterium]MBT5177362.1 TRAP transporter large permease [Rhodospirillaceae bacterium]
MSDTAFGLVGLSALFILLALRMPVALAMALVGVVGFGIMNGWGPAVSMLADEAFVISNNYELIVIPLFILMGNFASTSGMSRDLYNAAYAWFGHWRGGLASATIAACAGFAALSGSSVASAVTMGRVSLPEMKRFDYDSKLATGCIAAGGTLGILIPPSTGFIIYAILTEESIGRLFLAGVFPGILLAVLFMITIYIQTRINPKLGPAGPRSPMRDKVKTLSQATAMVFIVVVTIGGIYGGVFTPTEAAAVGAMLSFLLTLVRRRLTWNNLSDILLQTIRTTGLVFLILIGAHVFNPFLALTHIPDDLASLLIGADLSPHLVMLILMAAYIVLGSFLEGFAMLVLTLPIVHPMIIELGFDPIWFGVLIVIIIEIGLITPPVGVNVFVVKGIAGDVPLRDIFAGVIPFWFAMMACILILMAFPEIALFLPNTMIQSN